MPASAAVGKATSGAAIRHAARMDFVQFVISAIPHSAPTWSDRRHSAQEWLIFGQP
jgi:hypothetical protein